MLPVKNYKKLVFYYCTCLLRYESQFLNKIFDPTIRKSVKHCIKKDIKFIQKLVITEIFFK